MVNTHIDQYNVKDLSPLIIYLLLSLLKPILINLTIIYLISKQLCINVQLSQMAGGLDGSALYIDTNQGFSAIRLKGYK